MHKVSLLTAALLGVIACSGPSPVSPGDITGQHELTVMSARDPLVPVPGATVVVAGQEYRTSERGTVLLPASTERFNVEIRADGFISPRKLFISTHTTDLLIPDDPQLPFSWLNQVFYERRENTGLWLPQKGLIGIELSDELQADEHFPHAIRRAIATINAAQPHLTYLLVEGGGHIKMVLNPEDPYFAGKPNTWAFITIEGQDYNIRSAKVTWRFLTREGTNDHLILWHAAAHELGHHTGMWGHSPAGIMGAQWGISDFSSREKEAMTYVFYREPGTMSPDDSTRITRTPSTLRFQQAVSFVRFALPEPRP